MARVKINGIVYTNEEEGGGGEFFAFIKITYPTGDIITITHNGETITAPDTSGYWEYQCNEVGNYVVNDTTLSLTENVDITMPGEVKEVEFIAQVVNYLMLYYLGDECVDNTGGWTIYNNISSSKEGYVMTNTSIIFDDLKYKMPFMYCQYVSNVGYFIQKEGYYRVAIRTKGFKIGFENPSIYVSSNSKFLLTLDSYNTSIVKETNHIWLSGELSRQIRCNACGFIGIDDISCMSDYGTTIEEIITNASNLFNDRRVLQQMVLQCTGDFMMTALSNTTFINAMNNSPNKDILQANEHWMKFLALLSL